MEERRSDRGTLLRAKVVSQKIADSREYSRLEYSRLGAVPIIRGITIARYLAKLFGQFSTPRIDRYGFYRCELIDTLLSLRRDGKKGVDASRFRNNF